MARNNALLLALEGLMLACIKGSHVKRRQEATQRPSCDVSCSPLLGGLCAPDLTNHRAGVHVVGPGLPENTGRRATTGVSERDFRGGSSFTRYFARFRTF